MEFLEKPGPLAVLVVVSLVAAISMGGGFVAGVALAPFLIVAARQRTGLKRVGLTLLAAVLAAEVVWALVYVTVGESRPAIWLAPLLAAGAALAAGATPRRA